MSAFASLTRRRILKGAAIAGSTLAFPNIIRASPKELKIGGPGGQEAATKQYLIPMFEEKYSCKVSYSGSQSLPNLQKLQANRENPVFDVVMMDDPILLIAQEDGLLEKLPLASIPNMSKLVPGAVNKDEVWVNYMWPSISIANFVPKVPAVESWQMLWDSAYKERVLIPHPTTTEAPTVIIMAAHFETGKPPSEAQYDLDAAFKRLKELKPNLLDVYVASTKVAPLIEQGEAWLAGGFFSTYTMPRIKAGAPLGLARPKEGSFALPKGIAKVKGAANPELADAWINEAIGLDFQKVWMEQFYGAPTNVDAPINDSVLPAKDLIAIDWAFFSKNLKEMTERFDREIAG